MKEFYKRLLTGICLGLLVIITLFFSPPWAFALLAIVLLAYILFFEWPRLFKPSEPLFWILMPFYPLLPFFLIIRMQLSGYELMNIILFTVVATYDTGSYLVGKHWGKHKISPTISPGKTWEGFIGGVIFAFIFSLIYFGHNGSSTIAFLIFPFIVALSSLALTGDLFESALKRRVGVKDSGNLLPGHGGLLDRIDGMLFASVLVYALRTQLKLLVH